MVPGSNLLNIAMQIITHQTISYYQATGRTTNAVGQYVTTFASPVSIIGSFQPVPRRLYEAYGLDQQKSYFTFYTPTDLIDIQRDVSPDQIVFNSQTYQCESSNDWFAIDGWNGVLCSLIAGQAD